jgi:hypothetical protein
MITGEHQNEATNGSQRRMVVQFDAAETCRLLCICNMVHIIPRLFDAGILYPLGRGILEITTTRRALGRSTAQPSPCMT